MNTEAQQMIGAVVYVNHGSVVEQAGSDPIPLSWLETVLLYELESLVMASYEISCDKSRLDIEGIHSFLAQSYWSPGVPRAIVERAIANSLCFGVFHEGKQIGFARVITDKATFAYLADVYVLPEHRGRGLSLRLMERVIQHPDLQGLRRMLLATLDAHSLYEKFGFKPLGAPGRIMEIHNPDVYSAGQDRT